MAYTNAHANCLTQDIIKPVTLKRVIIHQAKDLCQECPIFYEEPIILKSVEEASFQDEMSAEITQEFSGIKKVTPGYIIGSKLTIISEYINPELLKRMRGEYYDINTGVIMTSSNRAKLYYRVLVETDLSDGKKIFELGFKCSLNPNLTTSYKTNLLMTDVNKVTLVFNLEGYDVKKTDGFYNTVFHGIIAEYFTTVQNLTDEKRKDIMLKIAESPNSLPCAILDEIGDPTNDIAKNIEAPMIKPISSIESIK